MKSDDYSNKRNSDKRSSRNRKSDQTRPSRTTVDDRFPSDLDVLKNLGYSPKSNEEFIKEAYSKENNSDNSSERGGTRKRPPIEKPMSERQAVQRPSVEKPMTERQAVQRPSVEEPKTEREPIQRPPVEKPTSEGQPIQRPSVEEPSIDGRTSAKQMPDEILASNQDATISRPVASGTETPIASSSASAEENPAKTDNTIQQKASNKSQTEGETPSDIAEHPQGARRRPQNDEVSEDSDGTRRRRRPQNDEVSEDSDGTRRRRRPQNDEVEEGSDGTRRRRPKNDEIVQGSNRTRRRRQQNDDSFDDALDEYIPSKKKSSFSEMSKRQISDTKNKKGKKKRTGLKVFLILLLVLFLAAGAVLGYIYYSFKNSHLPVDPNDTTEIAFNIKEGATTGIIANDLESAGLIRNADFFKYRAQKNGYDGKFKPGDFILTKAMSSDEIMEIISNEGDISDKVTTFTIPEGFTITQTRDALVSSGFMTTEEFDYEVLNGEFDYRFLEGVPIDENRLEGFLYPETYQVFKDATPHEIIDTMLSEFDSKFTEEHYQKAANLNLSVNEIVTIASLIERETMVHAERARVAGVIYNRLEKNMKLQIDATVQYALPEHKERLLYEDLKVDSPYNTYNIPGLPPGPICSPRIESIDGALNPEDHKFIYYVLDKELKGNHNFAETSEQFEAFKKEYIDAIDKRAAEKKQESQ